MTECGKCWCARVQGLGSPCTDGCAPDAGGVMDDGGVVEVAVGDQVVLTNIETGNTQAGKLSSISHDGWQVDNAWRWTYLRAHWTIARAPAEEPKLEVGDSVYLRCRDGTPGLIFGIVDAVLVDGWHFRQYARCFPFSEFRVIRVFPRRTDKN